MPRDDIICSARAIALYVWAFANPIFSALRHMDRYRLYIFYFIFIRHLYHNNRSYVTKIVWQTHIRFLYYYYAFTVELNKKKKKKFLHVWDSQYSRTLSLRQLCIPTCLCRTLGFVTTTLFCTYESNTFRLITNAHYNFTN
jgi:hypothetical protein